jgi:hypothetical protein
VEQKVLNPLWPDVERPLLLLEVLGGRLSGLVGLAQELLDRVRVEREEDSIEKVSVWQALVLLGALWVGQVVTQLCVLGLVDDLGVDLLYAEFGPMRDVS